MRVITCVLYGNGKIYEGKCLELMDFEKSFVASEVERFIHISLLCVQEYVASDSR